MKNLFLKKISILLLIMSAGLQHIKAIEVELLLDKGVTKTTSVIRAEKNLSALLTEINRAHKAGQIVRTNGMGLNDFAQKALARIWMNTPFYCDADDNYIEEHCWIFSNGTMLVSHLPIILTPNDKTFALGDYQEAVVEFDKSGSITDVRIGAFTQRGESLEHRGSVVDIQQRELIKKYVERFRTAYVQKDIKTIEAFFSDDALIITGNVVYVKTEGDQSRMVAKVKFNRQNKEEYISNLKKAFNQDKYIKVDFDYNFVFKGEKFDEENAITQSKVDSSFYGVRLVQKWKSSHYSDEGYLFLLWEFPEDDSSPVIHVRTWQPLEVEPDNDLMSLGGFSL